MTANNVSDTSDAESRDRVAVVADVTAEGILLLTVTGELDYGNVSLLEEALRPAGHHTPPRAVIDLHGVTFIDSSSINLFLATHQEFSSCGGWLRLAALSRAVHHVIQMLGIDTVITSYDTATHALTP